MGAIDLVVCGAEWSRERKATREESQALGTVLKTVRQVGVTVPVTVRVKGQRYICRTRARVWVCRPIFG